MADLEKFYFWYTLDSLEVLAFSPDFHYISVHSIITDIDSCYQLVHFGRGKEYIRHERPIYEQYRLGYFMAEASTGEIKYCSNWRFQKNIFHSLYEAFSRKEIYHG